MRTVTVERKVFWKLDWYVKFIVMIERLLLLEMEKKRFLKLTMMHTPFNVLLNYQIEVITL